MKDGNDVLIGSISLLKGNFAEAEGLVIGDEIEYSFNEHLGEGAKENEVIADNILPLRQPRCLSKFTHSLWRSAFPGKPQSPSW